MLWACHLIDQFKYHYHSTTIIRFNQWGSIFCKTILINKNKKPDLVMVCGSPVSAGEEWRSRWKWTCCLAWRLNGKRSCYIWSFSTRKIEVWRSNEQPATVGKRLKVLGTENGHAMLGFFFNTRRVLDIYLRITKDLVGKNKRKLHGSNTGPALNLTHC